jgi:hypothetical protein
MMNIKSCFFFSFPGLTQLTNVDSHEALVICVVFFFFELAIKEKEIK